MLIYGLLVNLSSVMILVGFMLRFPFVRAVWLRKKVCPTGNKYEVATAFPVIREIVNSFTPRKVDMYI